MKPRLQEILSEEQCMILHLYLMENKGLTEIGETMPSQVIKSLRMNWRTLNSEFYLWDNIMDELNDLETYNSNPVHYGWVDLDYNENTGELSDLFEDTHLDQYIDNLKDWD